MTSSSLIVAIVDDDLRVAQALRRLIRTLGHQAEVFQSGSALLSSTTSLDPTHILIDLDMPEQGGAALAARARARWPDALMLVMSGLETDGASDTCRSAGVSLVLKKPLSVEDLESFFESSA